MGERPQKDADRGGFCCQASFDAGIVLGPFQSQLALCRAVLWLASTVVLRPVSQAEWGKWTTGGHHMLSQLGLPASYSDTLTLIHSAGEVLRLAR